MSKINTNIKKQLEHLASLLPRIPIADSMIVSGNRIMSDDELAKFRSESIEPFKKYKIRSGGSISAVNHFRQLKKAFIKNGNDGVKNYMDKYRKPKS